MPGHVSVITGTHIYDIVASEYKRPAVITGFEAEDILKGIAAALTMIAEGRAAVVNAYDRTVTVDGNRKARDVVNDNEVAHLERDLGTVVEIRL